MRVRPPAGRRLSLVLPAAAAAALLAPPAAAHADTDMTTVVDSVAEAGYYVDSDAKYFQSDGALDLLRDNKAQHSPVFVAVLPEGESPDTVLNGLVQGVGRKGTYAVISGQTLRIRSTALPQSQVKTAYDKATSANASRPDKALISFVKLLPAAADMPPESKAKKIEEKAAQPPLAETGVGEDKAQASEQAEAVQNRSAQEATKDEGGFPVLPVAGGVVVVLLAGGGFLLWKRRGAAPAPAGAGAAGRPGGSPAPGTGPAGPGTPGAPGAPAPGGPGAPGSGPAAGGPQQQPPAGPEGGQHPGGPQGGQNRP